MSGSDWRKQTKARKSHQCDICCNQILPGEVYVRYDCTPWGHPDNDGYHTYRCCRFCDHMHYDVLDIADVDGYSNWEETVQEIRGHFYYLVSDAGILHPETDLETYADEFSRWTLAGGPFERCVGHPDQRLKFICDDGKKFGRCSRCAKAFGIAIPKGVHNPNGYYVASRWNAAQRFFRQYPRYLPEPISYEVALDLLKERDYDLTDPERVKHVIGWFGDTDNVRRSISELAGAR